MAIIELLYFIR